MSKNWILPSLFFLLSVLDLIAAAISPAVAIRTYDVPGHAVADPYLAVKRALQEGKLQKREDLQGNTTFSRSWDGAVLLKLEATQTDKKANITASESVEITCTKCYIQGLAKAEVIIPDSYNVSSALISTIDEVVDAVENVTETVAHDIITYFDEEMKDEGTKLENGFTGSTNALPYPYPQLNISFNVDVPTMPEVSLNFEFDGLEAYVQLDTSLHGELTYDLLMYTSETAIGIGKGTSEELGITFTVNLIITADADIDISSGFHFKFEDGLGLNIALFDNTVTKLIHNGGRFASLPVTIESAGVTLNAVLRIGVHAGVVMTLPDLPLYIKAANKSNPDLALAGGIQTSVYADLVDLTSSVTYAAAGDECEIKVLDSYQLGIMAVAGASVQAGGHTWGPAATTSIPVYTTTLHEVCVPHASPTTTDPAMARRADLSIATTTTTMTYTGVQCRSSVVGNCPASLLTTTRSTEVSVLSTTVSSGAQVTWPMTPGVADTVATTVPFSMNAFSLSPTSGSPIAYTASPTNIQGVESAVDAVVDHVSKKMLFGLVYGLGAGIVILSTVVAFVLLRRRDRYTALANTAQPEDTSIAIDSYTANQKLELHDPVGKTKQSNIEIQEIRDWT